MSLWVLTLSLTCPGAEITLGFLLPPGICGKVQNSHYKVLTPGASVQSENGNVSCSVAAYLLTRCICSQTIHLSACTWIRMRIFHPHPPWLSNICHELSLSNPCLAGVSEAEQWWTGFLQTLEKLCGRLWRSHWGILAWYSTRVWLLKISFVEASKCWNGQTLLSLQSWLSAVMSFLEVPFKPWVSLKAS